MRTPDLALRNVGVAGFEPTASSSLCHDHFIRWGSLASSLPRPVGWWLVRDVRPRRVSCRVGRGLVGACLVLDRDVPASFGRFLIPTIYAELPMVLIGTDSHKRTHTAVALDEVGRRLADKTVPATSDGHLALVSWAQQWWKVSFAGRGLPHHDPSARA